MLNLFELIGSKCICLRQGRSQWEVSFLLCSHIEGSYVLAEAYYREWPWEHFCLAWRWASCLKRKNKGTELCMILLVVLLQSCLRYGARIPIGGAKYRTIFFFFWWKFKFASSNPVSINKISPNEKIQYNFS